MWESWSSKRQGGKKQTDALESPKSAKSLNLDPSVNFKDMMFTIVQTTDDDEEDDETFLYTRRANTPQKGKRHLERQKLIIILVGLPGRGKTFLCNKLMCYLNWLGHKTAHFNVGNYRRKAKEPGEMQDSSFFSPNNKEGLERREEALQEALADLITSLEIGKCQIAILDATNSTEQRRQYLRKRFHGRFQYLFIESICHDTQILEKNYRNKMRFSPDYNEMDDEKAVEDFKQRILEYEKVYETITDRSYHYIKLIDMLTGQGHMDINRISGYIPGKIVFFLMQVCRVGLGTSRRIILSRHGESQYNTTGQLGGDSGVSDLGACYARLLPGKVLERLEAMQEDNSESLPCMSIWTSTLKRTIQTASHFPDFFPKIQWKALDEINAGQFEHWTYDQIKEKCPDEYKARKNNKLTYRYPIGESYMDVIQRLEPVITEIERVRESLCIVAHQAILRVIYGYFMQKPIEEIPNLSIPLHTIIELTPYPDGKMHERRFPVDVQALFPEMSMGMGRVFNSGAGSSTTSPGAMSQAAALPTIRSVSNLEGLADDQPEEAGADEAPALSLPVDEEGNLSRKNLSSVSVAPSFNEWSEVWGIYSRGSIEAPSSALERDSDEVEAAKERLGSLQLQFPAVPE